MNIHFIAIGGSAMHNLAIALKNRGYRVTGSDDEIFEPSRTRLMNHGLLPPCTGWNADAITPALDAVVLGMHARPDNPELLRAKELGLKIYSYPEYLYEQTKHKARVVVGGSHGKTTIASMVMHVLRQLGVGFDYMVGAQLDGFDNMVGFSHETELAVFEGDEYLTSPIDPRPKFHVYKPSTAVISGIAWDHINVFPTFESYKRQFSLFIDCIEPSGTLIYCAEDAEVVEVVRASGRTDIVRIPYSTPAYSVDGMGGCSVISDGCTYPVGVFGKHNMQNIGAARAVCATLGIPDLQFLRAVASFRGAAKRLQCLAESPTTKVFLDFAHSPSKVGETLRAVREAYPGRELVACLELHTFSSLSKDFLPQYRDTLQGADLPMVYFNPRTIEHKRLPQISVDEVRTGFGQQNLRVYTSSSELLADLNSLSWENKNLLVMTSGNFSGLNLHEFARQIVDKR